MIWDAYVRQGDRSVYMGEYNGALDSVVEQLVKEGWVSDEPEIVEDRGDVYVDNEVRLEPLGGLR